MSVRPEELAATLIARRRDERVVASERATRASVRVRGTATVASLARLRGEIKEDRAALARREVDLEEATRRLVPNATDLAALALQAWAIHGWSRALESIFERVARQLDREVPTGDRWHRELLAQALVEIPAVRPAIAPADLRIDLEELLGARHFLRHAYGADLDATKLAAQGQRLRAVAARVRAALDALDAFLSRAAAAAAKGEADRG